MNVWKGNGYMKCFMGELMEGVRMAGTLETENAVKHLWER